MFNYLISAMMAFGGVAVAVTAHMIKLVAAVADGDVSLLCNSSECGRSQDISDTSLEIKYIHKLWFLLARQLSQYFWCNFLFEVKIIGLDIGLPKCLLKVLQIVVCPRASLVLLILAQIVFVDIYETHAHVLKVFTYGNGTVVDSGD